jgi:hypothetical protein
VDEVDVSVLELVPLEPDMPEPLDVVDEGDVAVDDELGVVVVVVVELGVVVVVLVPELPAVPLLVVLEGLVPAEPEVVPLPLRFELVPAALPEPVAPPVVPAAEPELLVGVSAEPDVDEPLPGVPVALVPVEPDVPVPLLCAYDTPTRAVMEAMAAARVKLLGNLLIWISCSRVKGRFRLVARCSALLGPQVRQKTWQALLRARRVPSGHAAHGGKRDARRPAQNRTEPIAAHAVVLRPRTCRCGEINRTSTDEEIGHGTNAAACLARALCPPHRRSAGRHRSR